MIGVVLGLGFLLLLFALQAPLLAAVGVLTNLLATAAAFGVAKWVFQDGVLHSLLGFQSQGFLDAWGPVFFFAMIFAISMDYTVFLLSTAKEHWERTHDARDAMVGGLAHSGRVIFAAGAVMVAVFFTFALSGPAAAEGDGHHPRRRRAAGRDAVRLLLLPVLLRLMGRPSLVSAQVGAPGAPRRPLWALMSAVLFGHRIKTLTPAETWSAHRQSSVVLVDVRQRSEWCSGVVLGALRIPLKELNRRIGELPRAGTVVFLCGSGHRRPAGRLLRRSWSGIDAASVRGGILAWRDAGLPTSTPARKDEAA